MPIYVWKGKSASGIIQTGEIVAANPQEVYNILRERKIVPTSVKPKPKQLTLPFGKGVGLRDLSIFTRQFATMINAGLPLLKCLEIQEQQVTKPSFKNVLRAVITDVEGGSTLADALKKHKSIFSDLYVNMVSAGESGGALDVILNRLATYLEKNAEIIRKIRGAMIYPAMISIVMVVAVILMLTVVIPVFAAMYSGLGSKLPLPTQIVINLSNFLKKYIIYMIIVAIGIAIALRTYYRTENGHFVIDGIMLKIPIFGDLIKKQSLTRFSRTLSTLLSSGVNILEALEITAKTSGNKVIEKAILRSRSAIAQGESVATPLSKEKGLFPPMVVQMITIGEQTGGLDEMLNKVADFYDAEVDQAVENLMAAMEPIIMIVLGVVVGGMLMAMYLPIFKLATEFIGG
uniref:Type II secretion system F family protein n=1 Tax=candidate division WOR-3 bacterium TaxID=2052148 RepID=A0A7C4U737_UNCW3